MSDYKKDLNVNKVHITNEGFQVRVIKIYNSRRITIQFQDIHKYTCDVTYHNLVRGSIKNPFNPTTYGIGYIGVGRYVSWCNGTQDPVYRVWQRMLERCYDRRRQLKQPAYAGCSVDKVWHNFQNFAHWYCNNPDYNKGYELDKDILVVGNKIYSPSRCCLVPKEINNLFRQFNIGETKMQGVTKHYHKFKVKFQNKHIGSFDTLDKASLAYRTARQEYASSILIQYIDCIQPRVYLAAITNIHQY